MMTGETTVTQDSGDDRCDHINTCLNRVAVTGKTVTLNA